MGIVREDHPEGMTLLEVVISAAILIVLVLGVTSLTMSSQRHSMALARKTAANNEVLCKIICHNILVLIHEMYELGIEPEFYAAQKLAGTETGCTKTPSI